MNSLHEELINTRKTFSHSTHSAKNKIAQEELLTKEFFTTFKSRTNNGDIAELYAHEIFAIPAEDLREDKKSSQYLPSWDCRLFNSNPNNSLFI